MTLTKLSPYVGNGGLTTVTFVAGSTNQSGTFSLTGLTFNNLSMNTVYSYSSNGNVTVAGSITNVATITFPTVNTNIRIDGHTFN